jgi:uncharacterized protein (TIRG00374 family)
MRRWLVWIGVAVSVVFLFLALRGLKLDEFWRDLQRAYLLWLIPGIALYFIAVAFRAWRWSFLLAPLPPTPLGEQALVDARHTKPSARALFPIVVIGYMGNNIYPARIGELLRAYVLRRDHGVPISSSLATVLIERIVDGIVMVAFVLIGLRAAHNVSETVTRVIAVASVVFAIATVVFFVLALAPQFTQNIANAFINRLVPERFRAPLIGIVEKFVQGAQSLRSPIDLARIVGISLIVWLFETGKYWCVAQAFGLTVPFDGLMLVNGLSNLFTVIPGAPGAVGTFDAGGILGMTALGVEQSLSAAYVLILHVVLWLPVTALGAYFMLREGLRWGDLRKAEAVK